MSVDRDTRQLRRRVLRRARSKGLRETKLELNLLHRQMDEERRLLDAILQKMPVGLVVVEPVTSRVVLFNECSAAILDEPLSSGRRLDGIPLDARAAAQALPQAPPICQDRAGVISIVSDPSIAGAIAGDRDHGQATLIRTLRDGRKAFVTVNASVLRNSGGSPTGVVLAFVDVTTERLALERLAQAKEAAEHASRAKSTFLANVSHELRTPLGVILGFIDLLSREHLSRADAEHYQTIIRRNGLDLARLIDDLLDLSKIEAGKVDLQTSTFRLDQLLTEVSSLLALKAQERNIRIHVQVAPDVPALIETDPVRLRQILFNLVGNAIKFSPPGENVAIDVRRAQGGGQTLEFRITDRGVGIRSDQLDKLFKPFSQADSSTTRRFGGTGLGLALSAQLARLLGGLVTLEHSEPGRGSTFLLIIESGCCPADDLGKPQADLGTDASSDSDHARRAGADSGDSSELAHAQNVLSGLNVLVAEDTPDNQLLIRRVLSMAGAAVTLVADGESAVRRALEGACDLILMDIEMPVLDGLAATRKLRKAGFQKPILALTAYAFRGQIERCLEAGCDDCITKPVNLAALVDRLAREHVGGPRGRAAQAPRSGASAASVESEGEQEPR